MEGTTDPPRKRRRAKISKAVEFRYKNKPQPDSIDACEFLWREGNSLKDEILPL
jgi:hypothetical protein